MATDGHTVIAGQRDRDNRLHLFAIGLEAGGAAVLVERPEAASPGVFFGRAAAIDGSLLVVGATDIDGVGDVRGEAHVFARDDDGWRHVQRVHPESHAPTERLGFGTAVAIGPRHVAVGAPGASGGGLVFLFRRAGDGALSEPRTIAPPAGDEVRRFGAALALDGRTLVVGAPADGDDRRRPGCAVVFDLEARTYDVLEVEHLAAGSKLGAAVALSGDRVAIGAPLAGRLHATGARHRDGGIGEVHAYRRGAEGWRHEARLQPADVEALSFFGRALAMDDTRLVVGAPGAHVRDRRRPGAAYLFAATHEGWSPALAFGAETPIGGDGYGAQVGIADRAVLVAANESGLSDPERLGRIEVFEIR